MRNFNFKNKKRGFTLIELIVVIAIFLLISAIVMFNYKGFNSSVSVENLAQDIAINIRKAQVFSISTTGTSIQGSQAFPSYGIHFALGGADPVHGTEKAFVLFADVPTGTPPKGDKIYSNLSPDCNGATVPGDECIEVLNITSSDKITAICDNTDPANQVCATSAAPGIPATPGILDIVFTRPDVEADFCFKLNTSTSCFISSNVIIKIESITGAEKREIQVWSTGSINVK